MLPLIDQAFTQLVIIAIAALFCLKFARSVYRFLSTQKLQQKSFVDRINQCLPQTQCGQCGYEGCRPYARAIADGDAINKCPPGGNETIFKLARLTNEAVSKLNPAHGVISALEAAVIREEECIGCTKCIVACPVDAIIGGPKLMHTVIESECTGCDLCVESCPVDCIDMIQTGCEAVRWIRPSQVGSFEPQFEAQQ